MRLRWVGLLAVVTMIVASCGGGLPEATGPSEGIQVHGDWTIDIYNKDGTRDRHMEFENALVPTGQVMLAELLTGFTRVAASGWRIELAKGDPSSAGDSPCGQPNASVPCVVNAQLELPGDGRLILVASVEAEIDGDIGLVATQAATCDADDPTVCTQEIKFTEKAVSDENGARIGVDAGQQIQVEVELSFTSG